MDSIVCFISTVLRTRGIAAATDQSGDGDNNFDRMEGDIKPDYVLCSAHLTLLSLIELVSDNVELGDLALALEEYHSSLQVPFEAL